MMSSKSLVSCGLIGLSATICGCGGSAEPTPAAGTGQAPGAAAVVGVDMGTMDNTPPAAGAHGGGGNAPMPAAAAHDATASAVPSGGHGAPMESVPDAAQSAGTQAGAAAAHGSGGAANAHGAAPATNAAPAASSTTAASAHGGTPAGGHGAATASTVPDGAHSAGQMRNGPGAGHGAATPAGTPDAALAAGTQAAGQPAGSHGATGAPAGAPAATSGEPGTPGAAAPALQKGTREYPVVIFFNMAKSGNYAQAEEVISAKAKGLAGSVRAGELPDEKVASYKATFASPQFLSSRNMGTGIQFTFQTSPGEVAQFLVSKEGADFVIKDLKLTSKR